MKKKAKIIFMGTPEFAVPALKALHNSNKNPALVVTRPDRPKGRGRKVLPPPVKEVAINL
jgi:methionyl-tRNA formyltransferase